MNRFGKWHGRAAEDLSYGMTSGLDVVIQMLLSNRDDLFNPSFSVTGINSGPHKIYSKMTCIDYAVSYDDQIGLP
jgi:hypothetical protein